MLAASAADRKSCSQASNVRCCAWATKLWPTASGSANRIAAASAQAAGADFIAANLQWTNLQLKTSERSSPNGWLEDDSESTLGHRKFLIVNCRFSIRLPP